MLQCPKSVLCLPPVPGHHQKMVPLVPYSGKTPKPAALNLRYLYQVRSVTRSQWPAGSPLPSYPSTFHNGEPAKSTLLPSKRVLNGSDVADWALVAPRAENGTVSKISNQIIFSQCVVGFCGSCWKLLFDLGRVENNSNGGTPDSSWSLLLLLFCCLLLFFFTQGGGLPSFFYGPLWGAHGQMVQNCCPTPQKLEK